MRVVELPELVDLEGLGADKLEVLLVECETVRWRVGAMIAKIVGVAERTAAYVDDGHASVSGWAKAACNWSAGDTTTVVQTGRLLDAVPEARAAAHAGSLGTGQLRLLAIVGQPALRCSAARVGRVAGRARPKLVVRRVRGGGASLGSPC